METIWREYANAQDYVSFTMCRYGNVLGSNGSVLQVWQRQRDNGQPITITDPDHIRYWMTVDDAVDVVFEALFTAPNGTIVIPVVPSLSIIELARLVTGLTLGNDDVVVVGGRPGEKEVEWLLTEEESLRAISPDPSSKYVYLHPYASSYHVGRMRSDEAVSFRGVMNKLKAIGVIA
jgi:FlaA1/EpsC-like NDP-sugar epimerase